MRDIAGDLRTLLAAGEPFALATVIGARGSSPRPVGAAMAVAAGGEAVGSISGGCVEGAVYVTAEQVLAGDGPVVESYGYSDDDAFAVGLTCGGELEVLVAPADRDVVAAWVDAVQAEAPVALATVVGGPAPLGGQLLVGPGSAVGTLGTEGLDVAVTDDARGMLAAGQTGDRHYGPRGQRRIDDVTVFVQSFTPPPRMLVFGATDFAAAVSRIGVFLGYRVTVCDARPVFATARRFPEAHEVVCEWPHRYLGATATDARTVVCVLTHDPKFDVPLLEVALRRPAAYIGAMGSRRTHEDRLRRLREVGLTDDELARLHSPIGLDLGARTAEETAVSIAAEIVQARWGGSGRPLTETSGAIHDDAAVPHSHVSP
ncbi:MAG TPA: XdhC/CoxI family protein [Mycobacteriales bacterium]|nr:XdhC/CoxI family protein [Mycobacteriales bacterium]